MRGADVKIKDTKVGGTAAGWAEYGGHPDINAILRTLWTREACGKGNTDDVSRDYKLDATIALPPRGRIV